MFSLSAQLEEGAAGPGQGITCHLCWGSVTGVYSPLGICAVLGRQSMPSVFEHPVGSKTFCSNVLGIMEVVGEYVLRIESPRLA